MRTGNRNRMISFILLIVLLFLAATARAGTLSPYAEAVGRIIRFDRKVLLMMTKESGRGVYRMVGYDEHGFQIIADGVFVPVVADRTEVVLNTLRKRLAPLKYMAFIIDKNHTIMTDRIGVLKGSDQYEIVRVMHTQGREFEISNQNLIDRLKEWEKTAPFSIRGAGHDWMDIEFKKLPKDISAFVEEISDFCPNAVEQGAGNTISFSRDLVQTKKLFLSWD